MQIDYSQLKIIYHHPRPIVEDGLSGSQVRPFKMLQAFRELGVKVIEVTGDYRQRATLMQHVKELVRKGEQFDFVYSENITVPFAMSEPHRLPLHPLLDHRFLSFCHANGVPVSMFYRDIFWRDASYKMMLPWWGRLITVPLYHYDWWWHAKYSKILYIPSEKMENSLPANLTSTKILPLPPGANIYNLAEGAETSKLSTINILYIGGIEPPTYDLKPLLASFQKNKNVRLTICCREKEWNRHKYRYEEFLGDNTEIVHLSGPKLQELYQEADILAIVRNPTTYLDFAVPVKLFESIGFGVPILSTPGSEAARIVNSESLGWVKDLDEIPEFIDHLVNNPEELRKMKENIKEIRKHQAWKARAAKVCSDMLDEAQDINEKF